MSDADFFDDPRVHEIRDTALRVLATGPAAFDDLLGACRSAALTELAAEHDDEQARIFDDILLWTPNVWTTDERCCRLDTLLAGAVFTHRVTAVEIESGMIAAYPDLAILDADTETQTGDRSLTTTRGELRVTFTDEVPGADRTGAFVGPHGWLDDVASGDVLAFRRSTGGDPQVTIEVVAEPAADVITVQGLEERLSGLIGSTAGVGVDLFPILIDVMVAHPDAFRRETLPIAALLAQIGLEHRDEHVGPSDHAWEPAPAVQRRLRTERIALEYHFDGCCRDAFETVLEALTGFIVDDRPPADGDVAALNHGVVAPAFVEWELQNSHSGSPLLERFCDALIDTHSRHRAGAHFARAMNRQRNGDIARAEADLRTAVKLDPESPFAAFELAGYAAIRGNGKEAIRLLRRSGATPESNASLEFLLGLFERYGGTPRNDPCPCGSGRKYKACCAVRPRLTDSDRLMWLQRKLYEFVAGAGRSHVLWDLADHAAEADSRYDEDDADDFVDHVFLLDLAAFELSMDAFAQQYGPMLPADERDLLDVWRLSSRRLWEITAVDAAEGRITLRDSRTGDTADVLDHQGSEHATPGDFILARVAEGFGHDRLVGVVQSIDLRHRNALMEVLDTGGGAADLAHWYGWAMSPPVMTTTEGEPMVIAETRGTPGSGVTWDELIEALDANYRRIDDHTWSESAVNPSGETISRATITVEDGELVISTLSEERMRRVWETLPVLDIRSDTREPVDDPRRFGEQFGTHGELPEPTPEMAAMVDEIMDESETKWLNESIPALGGATPRQALDDPTRREDLEALLRHLGGATPGGFDAERIRRKLGLGE